MKKNIIKFQLSLVILVAGVASLPTPLQAYQVWTSTAFTIETLIRLQDEKVDMSNYYTADTSPWSMFGQFGIRRPVFHGYRAFNELAKRPLQVKVQVEGDTETPSCALAGIAEEKLSAAVLFSTFNGKSGTRAITLTHLPWKGETRVETLLVDDTHALTETPAIVDSDANGTKRITVNLASNVVCLVRLSQTNVFYRLRYPN